MDSPVTAVLHTEVLFWCIQVCIQRDWNELNWNASLVAAQSELTGSSVQFSSEAAERKKIVAAEGVWR